MNATHVANPVRVEAHQITGLREDERGLGLWAELSDGSTALIDAGMIARYTPKNGDYFVIQDDGYRYINQREVFERKYRPIGQNVLFDQDKESAEFLRGVAQQIEDDGLNADLCTVVFGGLGHRVVCATRNSTLKAIATLRMGEKIMLDVAMPNPTTTGDTP